MTIHSGASQAQQERATSEKSYLRARQVLEAGLRALGGLEAIAAIKNFRLREVGKHYPVDESKSAASPLPAVEREEITVVDFYGSRLFHERRNLRSHDTLHQQTIINGERSFRVNPVAKRATPISTPSLDGYPELIQKLPQFLLREVITRHAASLRWLGAAEERGRKQQVITFVDKDGRQVSLYFDARTKLLVKYDYLYTDGVYGDSRQEYTFPSYRSVGRFQVPAEVMVRFANQLAGEMRYEKVEIDGQLADTTFALPEGIEKVSAPSAAPPAPYTVTKLADDVYLLERIFTFDNVLFVNFNDYVLVVEAPESHVFSGASEKAIAKIKETLPGKPIKYLVITHHHLDHGGGARAYIAEGSTIVTTPGNQRFIERLAAAPFVMTPDALARNPRRPVIETVRNKKHVIRDDRHVVELYDVGPWWETDEQLIVYLPQHKLLYEGDLFTAGFGDYLGAASDGAVLLAEKIKQLGLDVERIVGTHGRVRPVEDLRRAIEKRAQGLMK